MFVKACALLGCAWYMFESKNGYKFESKNGFDI